VLMEIAGLAHAAGFRVHFAAVEPAAAGRGTARGR
jgi:hypothetical protein